MRNKRAKSYRKLMKLYAMSFGFRQPYQVLVDSTMCSAAIELKFDLARQLASVLQGEVKPMITQCCIHELYLQGKSMQPAVDLAKTFERRKCNHREAIPGDECVLSVIGESNKHRYVVATQSHFLRVKLRPIPAVPLLHITRAVLILEPPSDATVKAKQDVEEEALHAPVSDKSLIESSVPEKPAKKKRTGPKGPNPLSMKKKKQAPPAPQNKFDSSNLDEKTGLKRKRDEESSQRNPSRRKRKRTSHHPETAVGTDDCTKI
ncbi:hypothetical protein AX17_000002 [Amanita inopinata Kibby_2008]|nr:hypothetical protein AX17_000002 [Amanita inopinata Kibby_2008]